MATKGPALASLAPELASALLAEREVFARARILARHVAEIFPATSVLVYRLEGKPAAWKHVAGVGDVTCAESALSQEAGTLEIGRAHV